MQKNINIKNRKAKFQYELLDDYNAGIVLKGSEIKSIRNGKASISECFCEFNEKGELFAVNMDIQEYSFANNFNHKPKSIRKLLLNKKELSKLAEKVKTKGLTIIPLNLYINKKGFAKIRIALAKGKKIYDKRASIKEKESKRKIDIIKKNFNN